MLIPAVLATVLVVVQAVWCAAASAVPHVDREDLTRRADAGSRRARAACSVIERTDWAMPQLRVGVLLCAFGVGVLVQPFVAGAAEPGMSNPARPWVLALTVTVAISAQVVLAERVARSVGAQRPMGTLLAVGTFTAAATTVLVPVSDAASAASRRFVASLGVDRDAVMSRLQSRQDLLRLVQLSGRSGAIQRPHAEFLERTLRFGDKEAADVLTPRVEVESLSLDGSVGDLIDRSAATGFSRFPVHAGDLDDIVGLVHVKDVLGVDADHRRQTPLAALVRPVLAVPETKGLESLMVELRAAAGQFAVVVDEYGGTAGIVTLEDLIEEIVGDISDEHDPAQAAPVARRWAGAHLLSGALHPDEVAEVCGFDVPAGDYETIAGFVLSELGRIPAEGDDLVHEGWTVEVVEMDGNRIRTVKLVAPSPGALS